MTLYCVDNGILYRRPDAKHPNPRRVVRENEVVDVIASYHSNRPNAVGHWHRDATIKAIEKEVYI